MFACKYLGDSMYVYALNDLLIVYTLSFSVQVVSHSKKKKGKNNNKTRHFVVSNVNSVLCTHFSGGTDATAEYTLHTVKTQ